MWILLEIPFLHHYHHPSDIVCSTFDSKAKRNIVKQSSLQLRFFFWMTSEKCSPPGFARFVQEWKDWGRERESYRGQQGSDSLSFARLLIERKLESAWASRRAGTTCLHSSAHFLTDYITGFVCSLLEVQSNAHSGLLKLMMKNWVSYRFLWVYLQIFLS